MSVVANVAINVDARNAIQRLQQVQQESKATERAFGGLGGAIGRLGIGLAALQAGRFIFAKTAEIESQTKSLEVLTGSAQKAGSIIKELQQLGAVTPFTSTELIDSAKRLQAFGVETEKVVETTRRLADVSGATGAELQGLVTAYGQVQAKGRLQGEELLQFQERGVALQEELRKLYKLSGDEFQDALEKGRISAAAVEVAINRLTSVGGKYANGAIAQSDTLSGKLSTLQDGIDQLARVLGQTLSPVLKELIDDVTNFVSGFAQGLQVIQSNYNTFLANLRGKTSNELQGQIGQLDSFIASNQKQLEKIRPGSQTEKQVQAKIVELRNLRSSLQKDLDKKLGLVAPVGSTTLLPAASLSDKIPALLDPRGGSKKEKKGPKGPEDRTVSLQADLKALREIADAEDRIRDLRFTGQDALAVNEQLTKTLADIERDRVKQLEQANFATEKTAINQTASVRSLQAQRDASDELRQIELERVQKSLEAKQALQEAVQPILDFNAQQRIQLEDAQKFNRLVQEGILPAEAERLINFERLVQSELQSLDTTIRKNQALVTQLQTEIQALEVKADSLALEKASTLEIERQIQARSKEANRLQDVIDADRARQGVIANAASLGPAPGATNQQRLQDQIGQLKGQLNQLVDPINQITVAAQGIGDAFSQSFRDIISGTVPVQQALSNFFKQIANNFLDNAAQIIAAQLQIFVLQTLLGFAGGAAAGGGSSGGLGNLVSGFRQYSLDGPAPFAEGGFVTGPTNAVIGEGGQPEYVIPASKMSAAMSRYSRGVRGDAVIAGDGASAQSSAVATAPMEPIDVRYTVERINSVDYVTTDQFQRGLSQAAQQGAVQGERRALRTLSNSPANRRRIGL